MGGLLSSRLRLVPSLFSSLTGKICRKWGEFSGEGKFKISLGLDTFKRDLVVELGIRIESVEWEV